MMMLLRECFESETEKDVTFFGAPYLYLTRGREGKPLVFYLEKDKNHFLTKIK